MRRVEMGRVHVFPYSERRGTLAATLPGRVEPHLRAERAAEAAALGAELLGTYAERFVGHVLDVLSEGVGGYTPHFLEASWGADAGAGEKLQMEVRSAREGKLEGCLI